ncbi:MAG: hypothetical protein E6750_20180 [Atlantibacter hermannii]|uniref:hypothetical protein n=1 Tax=Atlantibacter hermannii TaxID=565 RepID=UPI00289B3325|nr:hypothetical protein [Atlantibacter hermannii]MDU1953701.1 hypothetical protein [Atlantibacter hermannii]
MENEKAELILNAIGEAVVDLVAMQVPITKDNLVDRLEHNRKATGNVIGKGAYRDAADLVRKGQ